ncbi:MAG: hypothetical protein H3C47_12325 [Candidatus Cloacimonetes bacterium]|nr:hypothetical protein [Candidatus Cloacimonadota bacterium]
MPVLLFLLLSVNLIADKSRYVFSNQDDRGVYQNLVSQSVTQSLSLTGQILIDGATMEPGINNTFEIWTTGAIQITSTTPSLVVSSIHLDEYNNYGDYMQTVKVPGSELWVLVEFLVKNQPPVLSGFQKIHLREVESGKYACNFQLVYSIDKTEIENRIPDKNRSALEARITVLHQGAPVTAQSKVLSIDNSADASTELESSDN